ncbi:LAME_0G01596g1_1 [Lachancea meyersii CBS 8951]|uniref:LAME_0G01596g1_1 n=1 Tax=Lachancea meyersii CBS 8951 TaxID=1266667 RepID=A0A1G4K5G3_9SACH|nr:LAME_0G01596g1_1 [Lachancea meyersii CBS 8951]
MSCQITQDWNCCRKTLSIVFKDSNEHIYLCKKFLGFPVDKHHTPEFYEDSFNQINIPFLENGGFLLQAKNYDCVAVVAPPDQKSYGFQETEDPVFNKQFIHANDELKTQLGLGTKIPCYYLFLIGKNLEHPEIRGGARAVMEWLKNEADRRSAAVVLEALNSKVQKVYEHFGFKTYCSFSYGVGEVNSDGDACSDGTGFTSYFMVYIKNEALLG